MIHHKTENIRLVARTQMAKGSANTARRLRRWTRRQAAAAVLREHALAQDEKRATELTGLADAIKGMGRWLAEAQIKATVDHPL